MLRFYKTDFSSESGVSSVVRELDRNECLAVSGIWINAIAPTDSEISFLEENFNLNSSFLKAALDEEESARVEYDPDERQTLIIIDYPVSDVRPVAKIKKNELTYPVYYTLPMGLIVSENAVATVCLKNNDILADFSGNLVKDANTMFRTQFIFNILLKIAGYYLKHLKQIDKLSSNIDSTMRDGSMKNEELFKLMELSKSLVYFSVALKSANVVMSKLFRGKYLKLYEEDRDLLDDVSVEFNQATEMSETYANIITRNTESFANIINNNLNAVMKLLTIITIVLAVPSIVFSFYGMNVDLPLATTEFSLGLSFILAALATLILTKIKIFK